LKGFYFGTLQDIFPVYLPHYKRNDITMNSSYLIIGNWKMKIKDSVQAEHSFKIISEAAYGLQKSQAVICPSIVHLSNLQSLTHDYCKLGAQDVFWESAGAYTGMVSAAQITDAGASYVLLGHSELRALGETDGMVAKKLSALAGSKIMPVVLVGERERDDQGQYIDEVRSQVRAIFSGIEESVMQKVIIAYEPIWAISTNADGRVCTPEQCAEMVQIIQTELEVVVPGIHPQYLYGGSANRDNAQSFLMEGGVSGLVPGSASLDPDHFVDLLNIAELC
jgi:triosephosphate isomerase